MNDGSREDPPEGKWVELPPRLVRQVGRGGELVRRYMRRPHGGSEERSWKRIVDADAQRRLEDQPLHGRLWTRGRLAFLTAVAAAAGVAAAATGWTDAILRGAPTAPPISAGDQPPRGMPSVENLPAPSAPTPAGPPTMASAPTPTVISLRPRVQRLGAGRWRIPDEALLDLGHGTHVRANQRVGGSTTLKLASGRIALSVVHKPRPAPFRVTSPPYVFTVLGTVFRVERSDTRIDLAVSEGRVAVSRAGRNVATITAGGTWTGRLAEKAPEKAAPATPIVPPTQATVLPGSPVAPAPVKLCRGEASTQLRLTCLQNAAKGSGLAAETALYEVGKILRDDLYEPGAALDAFKELRQRFPAGALRIEAALSVVELLARTGRYQQALDESAALLARGATREREAELYLLRGNVYREALGDLRQAAEAYRLATAHASRGSIASEARFLLAASLEALGKPKEATDHYRRYLEGGGRARQDEARLRLQQLNQTSGGQVGSKAIEEQSP